MTKLHEIPPETFQTNPIRLIGQEWMLITAGDKLKFNMMTASWGGVGFLWGMPVSFCFVRPQRYTYKFMEKVDFYTLSFFDSNYRDILNLCGTKSGRDMDKVAATGLTPVSGSTGAIYFSEARMVFECRKLYTHDFQAERFVDTSIPPRVYAAGDYHRMYVGEIVKCLSY